jgi:hypothetical protein
MRCYYAAAVLRGDVRLAALAGSDSVERLSKDPDERVRHALRASAPTTPRRTPRRSLRRTRSLPAGVEQSYNADRGFAVRTTGHRTSDRAVPPACRPKVGGHADCSRTGSHGRQSTAARRAHAMRVPAVKPRVATARPGRPTRKRPESGAARELRAQVGARTESEPGAEPEAEPERMADPDPKRRTGSRAREGHPRALVRRGELLVRRAAVRSRSPSA